MLNNLISDTVSDKMKTKDMHSDFSIHKVKHYVYF